MIGRTSIYLAIASVLALAAPAYAKTVAVGDSVTISSISDQFDQRCSIDQQTRVLIFSSEKSVNVWISAFLSQKTSQNGTAFMRQNGWVYVADISSMPAMITRTFAMPKMRKLTFPICLGLDVSTLADLPRREGFATVFKMQQGVVQSIDFAENAVQLNNLLTASAQDQ